MTATTEIQTARGRVLATDDESGVRLLLKESLSDVFDVDTATDGEDALRQLGLRQYDILITDWTMPGMNGFELIKRVRRMEQNSKIGILVFTGYAADLNYAELMVYGVEKILEKPFNIRDLKSCVAEAYNHRQNQTPLASNEGPDLERITFS